MKRRRPRASRWKAAGYSGFLIAALAFSGCYGPSIALPEPDPTAVAIAEEAHAEAFLRQQLSAQVHVHQIAFPLRVTIAREIPALPTKPVLGFMAAHPSAYPEEARATAERVLGDAGELVVTHVVAESPAAEAGLRPGDLLIAVNEAAFLSDQSTASDWVSLLRSQLSVDQRVEIKIRRDGVEQTVKAVAIESADYPVRLTSNDAVNARAWGRYIELHAGMRRFAQSEDELAFVIAHEFAHNALRHHRKVTLNYLLGTLGDAALLAMSLPSPNLLGISAGYARSAALEAEADYIALLLMREAGFDMTAAERLILRLAAETPPRTGRRPWFPTHPDFPERLVRLRLARKEMGKTGQQRGPDENP